ncbi:MAG TPA: thiamine-phosphate kinase [Pyrinomonadaceae bacterium]|nr:thiamine-phosphate kinase [Pyrinomonadaceae bacterium]
MNEFDFIERIRKLASERGDAFGVVRGIGDDAAVLKSFAGSDVVVSTDLLVEDVDFQRHTAQPDLLGHKALAVSLSDIAAMGARPRWALLSVGVPEGIWNSGFMDEFYSGFFQLAKRYDVALVGGDVSRTGSKIVIDSILLGESAKAGAVFRSGAQPGDQIFVTGFLGDAAAGLRLIERGARLHQRTTTGSYSDSDVERDNHRLDPLLLRQLKPEPRVGWGLLLGEQQLATAMIDISDGLSSDLNHLCTESEVGAVIDAAAIPINPLVIELTGRRALDPLMLALHGGEDFEMLFTVAPTNVNKLPRRVDGVRVTRIGEVAPASDGVRVLEGSRTWTLEPGGWQHFKG